MLLLIIFNLTSCSTTLTGYPLVGQVFMISVSSDGQYAVTTSFKGMILWDIKNKQKKLIAKHVNIFSAYFIKHSHLFMWQDLRNIVHIENVDGKEVLSFYNFPVYGQVMTSDLKHYFASDASWSLYNGYGSQQKKLMDNFYDFWSAKKLLNLVLSNDDRYLMTCGFRDPNLAISADVLTQLKADPKIFHSYYESSILWDVNTGKLIRKYRDHIGKTIAIFSPDNHYIISGDEDTFLFVSDLQTNMRHTTVNGFFQSQPADMADAITRDHLPCILAQIGRAHV